MNGYPAPAPRPVWVQSNWIVSLLLTRRKITRKKITREFFYLYLMFFRDTWYWKSSELRLSEARGDIIGGLQKHKLRFTDTYLAASWSYLLLNISALFITVHNIHIIHNTQYIYFNSNLFIMPFYSTISALIPFCSSWRINKYCCVSQQVWIFTDEIRPLSTKWKLDKKLVTWQILFW